MHRSTRPFVTMRFETSQEVNSRLHVLASRLRVPIREILNDAIHLALRYHGDGHGIPQPPVRVTPVQAEAEEQEVEIEQVVEIEQPDAQGAGA